MVALSAARARRGHWDAASCRHFGFSAWRQPGKPDQSDKLEHPQRSDSRHPRTAARCRHAGKPDSVKVAAARECRKPPVRGAGLSQRFFGCRCLAPTAACGGMPALRHPFASASRGAIRTRASVHCLRRSTHDSPETSQTDCACGRASMGALRTARGSAHRTVVPTLALAFRAGLWLATGQRKSRAPLPSMRRQNIASGPAPDALKGDDRKPGGRGSFTERSLSFDQRGLRHFGGRPPISR
jgi:hypothetical protein